MTTESDTLYSFALHAPQVAPPHADDIRSALLAEGFEIEEDPASVTRTLESMYDGMWGAPPSDGFQFVARPANGSLPLLLTFTPFTTGSGTLFTFGGLEGLSHESIDAHVWTTDEESVRTALELMERLMRRLGLALYDDEDTPESQGAPWDRWRKHQEGVLDRQSIDARTGAAPPDRIVGLDQHTTPILDGLCSVDQRASRVAYLTGTQYQAGESLVVDGIQRDLPPGAWTEVRVWRETGFVLMGEAIAMFDHAEAAPVIIEPETGIDIVTDQHLVVGFGDEAIFGGDEVEEQGVVGYDLSGEIVMPYRKHFGEAAVDIADCYVRTYRRGTSPRGAGSG